MLQDIIILSKTGLLEHPWHICGVLIVALSRGKIAAGVSMNWQSTEPALLAYTLVVNQLIDAKNKIDKTGPPYSKKSFTDIFSEMQG